MAFVRIPHRTGSGTGQGCGSGLYRIDCPLHARGGVKQLGIDVRAGVHTGECEMMGDNVGGIAVNIGARIMSNAKPGSVLVSGTVKDLVAGSGIEFDDIGTHALEGGSREWKVFVGQTRELCAGPNQNGTCG